MLFRSQFPCLECSLKNRAVFCVFNASMTQGGWTELTAAVLTDGENMVSEWMEDFWSRTRMKKQRVQHESEVFIDLLEISYNGQLVYSVILESHLICISLEFGDYGVKGYK